MVEELIYSGKAKDIYQTADESVVRTVYKDQVTMLNGARKEIIEGKGILNNQISSLIFEKLQEAQVATHFIERISEREQLNRKVDIIPLEVVLRNVAAGSFSKRFGIEEGLVLQQPIIEFYYKKDELDDPFINDEHVAFLGIATEDQLVQLKEETRRVNAILTELFDKIGLRLIDFKLEFGLDATGNLLLADEISPDNCRLWTADGTHMDKDVFRRNLGDVLVVYREVLEKLKTV